MKKHAITTYSVTRTKKAVEGRLGRCRDRYGQGGDSHSEVFVNRKCPVLSGGAEPSLFYKPVICKDKC